MWTVTNRSQLVHAGVPTVEPSRLRHRLDSQGAESPPPVPTSFGNLSRNAVQLSLVDTSKSLRDTFIPTVELGAQTGHTHRNIGPTGNLNPRPDRLPDE